MSTGEAWQEIRALRAAPPGLASRDRARRRTFNAALWQAQELAESAAVAGYAARPLPLFYALSQAGRAIAACRLSGAWELRGHGAKVREMASSVLDTTVVPEAGSQSSFAGVARAVGSPGLAGAVELGALWAASPDLSDVPIVSEPARWPRGLRVSLQSRVLASATPWEVDDCDPNMVPVTTGGWVGIGVTVSGRTAREVAAGLEAYPTLRGARPYGAVAAGLAPVGPEEPVHRMLTPDGASMVTVGVPIGETVSMRELWDSEERFASLIEPAGAPFVPRVGYVLPELGGGFAPHPLMLWWALLLGLSSLARYQPAAWAEAIDPAGSRIAVGLERVLETAAERMPARILSALHDA